MGLFTRNQTPTVTPSVDVAAADIAPWNTAYAGYIWGNATCTRTEAMSVPAIARIRNLICSTVASLPLEQRYKMDGSTVEPQRVINQPDPRIPGATVYAWLAEDILFDGVGYGIVMEQYSEDSRIKAWTRVAPERITPLLNAMSTEVTGYMLDGNPTPISGVGSIIQFPGMDEGLLNRAGRTIRMALNLEKAAENYAKEPLPLMVLKSSGNNLPKERVTALLESWKVARQTRSTAFMNADVDLQAIGFDPKSMQLSEGRQYVALELARAAGIPAYFISAESTSMTYSNAQNERKSLIDFSLRPILTSIEQRLSMWDFIPSNQYIEYDMDDFLRGNALERAQVYEIFNRIGVMTPEQIAQEEDLVK
jgi:HK97 family phage portal protein